MNKNLLYWALYISLLGTAVARCGGDNSERTEVNIKQTYSIRAVQIPLNVRRNIHSMRNKIPITHPDDFSNEERIQYNRGLIIAHTAEQYLGITYNEGGRLTKKNPKLDCIGLVMKTYSEFTKADYAEIMTHYDPSRLIESGVLGSPIKDLYGAMINNDTIEKLMPGDVIYYLSRKPNHDKPVFQNGRKKYWVTHMALFYGIGSYKKRQIIHADKSVRYDDITSGRVFNGPIIVTRIDDDSFKSGIMIAN